MITNNNINNNIFWMCNITYIFDLIGRFESGINFILITYYHLLNGIMLVVVITSAN